MSLINWNDRPWLSTIGSAFDDLFTDENGFVKAVSKGRVPAVNVSETADNFILELAAPGKEKKDFKIEVDKNVLTVSSEKEESTESTEKDYVRKEYSYSSFLRTFHLPENVNAEDVSAKYEKGILYVTLPKKEPSKPEVKTIAVG